MRKTIIAAGLAMLALTGLGEPSTNRAPLRVALTFDDGNKDHLLIAAGELEKRGWRGVFNLITDKIGANEKCLTWEDVRELVRRGHEITTHTRTHPNLVKMMNEGKADEVRREIAESRDAITKNAGVTPRYMCSPYVAQNEATAKICREVGLTQMLSCRHNFGAGNEDQVKVVVERCIARGDQRLDLLHHGVSAADHGGWRAFRNREAFAHHLDLVAELEREGKVIVTDYDGLIGDCALTAKEWPRHAVSEPAKGKKATCPRKDAK